MQINRPRSAVPFIIKNDQTNTYELSKQAEDLLRGLDNKRLSVVSVAGLYRTGKSYLLNSVILDKKNIFGVGPTVNPCTKGLWLWVEPDPTNEKRSMLVIDTEGLGALDEEANHDMKIFCLAVLLSTTFIYNSVGSIDESALQTLSLVLNLVNNIDQDNTSNRPEFIWVVRDFSLQLVDDKGRTLTPSEYLEMALTTNTKEHQKAMIRKSITTAFSKRDCFTLVKPLIDETRLQNLDHIPLEELRPEFVSQSIELRNKIKSSLKDFQLISSKNHITGKEYILVIQKYLCAINTGAVPNMVDTWTFIREEKCREAMEEIKKVYSEKIKTKIVSKIPMRKTALDEQLKSIKEEIKSVYLKMTYDEISIEPVDEFTNHAFGQVEKLNQEENRQYIKSTLQKEFEPFLKKLYSDYYNNFEEFEKEIGKNYKESLIEKYRDRVDDMREHVERFTDLKLIENFKYFEKKLKQEMTTMATVKNELEITLNKQIEEMNQIKDKERRNQQEKVFSLEKKLGLYENEREQIIEFAKTEKELIEANLTNFKRKNEELNSQIEEQNREIQSLRATQSQQKDKYYLENKEYQKEKALFTQKEDYLNGRVRELEAKFAELKSKSSEDGGKFETEKKYLTKQYQDKIENLEFDNKRLSEKLIETESKLSKILDEAKEMSEQIQSIKQCSMSEKKQLEKKIMEAESNKKTSKIEQDLKNENNDLSIEIVKANERCQDANKRVKVIQEEMKNQQSNYQKEIAIHTQQIQFQQIEIADWKDRYEELKKSYQNALENLHDSSKNQEHGLQLKIYELTSEHQNEIKNLQIENEDKMRFLKKETEMLQKHKEELISQQSLDRKGFESKEKDWKESNRMLQVMVQKLEDKLQSSEKDHDNLSNQKESFFSLRIRQLEQELDEVKEKACLEISENTKKSEEAFGELKQLSEIEKQQWEKRITDEKEKTERKLKCLRDEHEKKLNEERTAFEEEISELQTRVVHMEKIFNERLQNMQYDHDIAIQKITIQFNDERVQLNKEVALLQQNLDMTKTNFDKELSTKIRYYESTLESTKASLRKEFEDTVKRLTEEKESLEQKLETVKKSNRQLEQNNLILKSESDKERAVFKEKEKSLERKVIEIENRLQSELAIYNKSIENINEKHCMEIEKLNDQINKLNLNVASLQEERDKIETEHENNINRLNAKLRMFEESKNKSKLDYEDIVNKFQTAVTHFGNQKKKLLQDKEKGLEDASEKANECIKQVEEGHKKMLKESEDRIARLVTENKSLKERIMLIEIEKSTSSTISKKSYLDDGEKEKMERKYEKRIDEYKEVYEKEKEKSKKLKEENAKLRMEVENSSFIPNNSQISYVERPSISDISNSRLYNANNMESKRKLINTPITQKAKHYDSEEHSGILRFNQGTGYRNNSEYR